MNTLYTRHGCPACDKAREILAAQGMEYEERVKPDGMVPVLVGGDSGDQFMLANLNGNWRFVKAVLHD